MFGTPVTLPRLANGIWALHRRQQHDPPPPPPAPLAGRRADRRQPGGGGRGRMDTAAMTDNSASNSGKRKMPKGKPFEKGDPRINRAGAPKRGQSWQETVKRITDMTREELIEYVGAGTKMGKLLKELPPAVPLKDALVIVSIIAYGRDPNPRLLATLMDREEGKPVQPIGGDPNAPLKVIVEYADSQSNPTDPTRETSADQE